GVAFVAFDPRGKRMATGGRNGELRLLYVDGPATVTQGAEAARPRSAAFSPDAHWLAVGDIKGAILAVDATTATAKTLANCGGSVRTLAWLDAARLVARCGSGDAMRLVEYSVPSGAERPIASEKIAAFALSPDARRAALVGLDGELTILDVQDGKRARMKPGAKVRAIG